MGILPMSFTGVPPVSLLLLLFLLLPCLLRESRDRRNSMHDLADIIVKACSHLCGQARCFTVDGVALPLCQRCLGLYLGALVTLAWLIATGIWRRGLPGKWVIAVHVAALLAAGAGGLHAIDAGPRWRLACGLLTGHVTAFWLAAGIACLWRGAEPGGTRRGTSPRLAQIQAWFNPR
jgi:uncharacterized membrane protein